MTIATNFFTYLFGNGYLRPLELATYRLKNMIEILTNWNTYFPYSEYLTQRGGTFLLDSQNNVIFTYKPGSLLCYSSDKSKPLAFLDEFLLK